MFLSLCVLLFGCLKFKRETYFLSISAALFYPFLWAILYSFPFATHSNQHVLFELTKSLYLATFKTSLYKIQNICWWFHKTFEVTNLSSRENLQVRFIIYKIHINWIVNYNKCLIIKMNYSLFYFKSVTNLIFFVQHNHNSIRNENTTLDK